MGRLTTHVLNLATGRPAAGMRIQLCGQGAGRDALVQMRSNVDGRCDEPLLEGDQLTAGRYLLTFCVAEYFRALGVTLPEPPFIDEVTIAFGVSDAAQNYHVPLLVSPWAYSTYRGS